MGDLAELTRRHTVSTTENTISRTHTAVTVRSVEMLMSTDISVDNKNNTFPKRVMRRPQQESTTHVPDASVSLGTSVSSGDPTGLRAWHVRPRGVSALSLNSPVTLSIRWTVYSSAPPHWCHLHRDQQLRKVQSNRSCTRRNTAPLASVGRAEALVG